ncbi:hypothetical protein ABTY96_03130 [Streptomyces sp. NPDC096057]|uniref:hypothetical protein n=1 Tax=Streptomyces sp. NPDC096057 TaxID=3155543 RepID=UPI003318A44A
MNYEETYIVEVLNRDGQIDAEPYTDMGEAWEAYTVASRSLDSGRVCLHRTSSVILATTAKA